MDGCVGHYLFGQQHGPRLRKNDLTYIVFIIPYIAVEASTYDAALQFSGLSTKQVRNLIVCTDALLRTIYKHNGLHIVCKAESYPFQN